MNQVASPAAGLILFVCIENSSRSVMAEGFAKKLDLKASSGGTFPASHTNPLVVEVMEEVGVDVSQNKPKDLTEKMIDEAAVVVLTDASLEKAIPGNLRKRMRKRKVVQWNVLDPQGRSLEEIRYIRDDIRRRVDGLANELSSS
jgi:protein-tyrosine-phosphatase